MREIDLILYHNHLCQLCKKSLHVKGEGNYRYYHPNCIKQARKGKKLTEFVTEQIKPSKILYDDERDEKNG